MKSHLHLMDRAFAVLESLPQKIAFGIFRKLDLLTDFPLMGSPLGPRFPKLAAYRQLIYERRVRIIYEYDDYENTVYVLYISDCRQKMPAPRDLKRDPPPEKGLPLE